MTVSAVKEKAVLQAIEVLRSLNKQYFEDSSKKKPLLEDEEKRALFLQVILKKIPRCTLTKMIKVNLPHPLIKDTDEICLITGDLDKRNHKAEIEPDVLHYKELLNKHGITHITEVVTLRQLRTEYKPYEAKQKLLAAYDIFLADNKIAQCLPRVLGKHFMKKRKFPIQINMKTQNLKQQVERALSTKVFYITGQGSSCCSEVAYLDMDDSKILDNVRAMTETLYEKLPGTWDNVMGVYLKFAKSEAIPLYVSYGNPNEIDLPEEKEQSDPEMEELSTMPNVKVKVYNNLRVETVYMGKASDMETIDNELLKDPNFNKEELDEDLEKIEEKNFNQVKSSKETKASKSKKKNNKESALLALAQSMDQSAVIKAKSESKGIKKGRKESSSLNEYYLEKGVEIPDVTSKKNKAKKGNKEKVPNNNENDRDLIQGKKKGRKDEDANENISFNMLDKSVEIVDVTSKKNKAKKVKEEKVPNTNESNKDPIQQKKKGRKAKDVNENVPFNILDESVEILDVTSKKNKDKKGNKEKVTNNSENDSDLIQGKKKGKKDKDVMENISFNMLDKSLEIFDVTSKKSKGKEEKILNNNENNKDSIQGKKKGRKTKDIYENVPFNMSDENKSVEKNEKLKMSKRKRAKSESVIIDPSESINSETPLQAKKKRKIEGINMKKFQTLKESRKSKRKTENRFKDK